MISILFRRARSSLERLRSRLPSLFPARLLLAPVLLLQWLFRKRPIRFTRFGVYYILFSLGVGAAAINTGNNLLYVVLGILLGLIIVSGILSDSSLWGLRTRWHPLGDFYAGAPTDIRVEIRKSGFPGVLCRVVPYWNEEAGRAFLVPWVARKSAVTLRTSFAPLRRGRLQLGRVRYSSFFPFGLFEKRHDERLDEEWIVFPAVHPVSPAHWRAIESAGVRHAARAVGEGSAPYVLRDYRMGDPSRRIHWKKTVRTGKLYVNEMEAEAGQARILRVDQWPENAPAEDLDDLVSFIASLIADACRRGRPMGLLAPDRYFPPESSRNHLARVLRYLALVEGPVPARRAAHRAAGMDAIVLWKSARHAA